MPRESEKRSAELKAGIFIIAILAALVFSVLWLRYFSISPVMTICARFIDPGPVATGFPVYYQGINIGEISSVEFSENFRYTIVCMEIYKEGLRIPCNVYAQIRQEGITGQKYISLIYPEDPSQVCLIDGSLIEGRSPFGLEEVQAYVEQLIKSGRLERILTNLEQTLVNANETSKRLERMSNTVQTLLQANKQEINNFFQKGSRAATDISQIAENINDFVGDPETQGDLRSTIRDISGAAESLRTFFGDGEVQGNARQVIGNIGEITQSISEILADVEIREGLRATFGGIGRLLGKAETAIEGLDLEGIGLPEGLGSTLGIVNTLLKDVDELVKNINCYTGDIYKDVKQTNLVPNVSEAFGDASKLFGRAENVVERTGDVLERIDEVEFDSSLKCLIVDTIQNINQAAKSQNQAAKQVDCFTEAISEVINKRFLLLRLLFGKPGTPLEKCDQFSQYIDTETGTKVGPCPIQKQPTSTVPVCPNLRTQQPSLYSKPDTNVPAKPVLCPEKNIPCPTPQKPCESSSTPCPVQQFPNSKQTQEDVIIPKQKEFNMPESEKPDTSTSK